MTVGVEDLVFSNSKLNKYRRCPNQYKYRYVLGLEPKARKVQLERGTWIHRLLQVYYNGGNWKAEHKRLTKEFYQLFEEERDELGDMDVDCLRIMKAYLRVYKDDFERYRVIDTELDETVTLPSGIKLRVIIDLVLEDLDSGLLFAWDHKTRSSFSSSDDMLLDPQLTRYYRGLQLMGYTPLGGVGYNEIRTKPPTIPKLTAKTGKLSKAKNIDTDVHTYMTEIRRHGFDPREYADILRHLAMNEKSRFFQRTLLPKDPPMLKIMMRDARDTAVEIVNAHNKNRFPRTFDKSCKWGCEFKNLCLAELHGADVGPMVKMNFTTKEQRKRHGTGRR